MRWVTYFTRIANVHLTKEVGLMPYLMGQQPGWESALTGHFEEAAYPALEGEVKGLQVDRLEDKGKTGFLDRATLAYLNAHAREIDVLHLFHLSRDTLLYGVHYKRLHPRGKLYLKLDAYNAHLAKRKTYSKNKLKQVLLGKLERRFLRLVDLVSVENVEALAMVERTYPELRDKVIYLPNGAHDAYIDRVLPSPPPKEKLLLCVSRPGSPEKNVELLIRALPYLRLPEGWRIEVVGPCTPEFAEAWIKAQAQYPAQSTLVEFRGEVSDRVEVYRTFARASVCFLTSRAESFGIAYAEALYLGSVLVGHKGMYAYDDLSANGQFGSYYTDNDPQGFAQALQEGVLLSQKAGMAEAARKHGQKHFGWSGIVEGLRRRLGKAPKLEP